MFNACIYIYRRIVNISVINSYRLLWIETFTFTFKAFTFIRGACSMERKHGGNHRCESTGANFPCGGTKLRLRWLSCVRSCRKNALGRSAVLAENSTCRPDGVAGRLNRTISSRTNCLNGRSVAAGTSCAKWLFANEAPGTEEVHALEMRRDVRRDRWLARSPVQPMILSSSNGALALEVS